MTAGLAESLIGLYKTERIRRRGSWKGIDDVEFPILEGADWFNYRRLLEPIGYFPPAESGAAHDRKETLNADPDNDGGLILESPPMNPGRCKLYRPNGLGVWSISA